MRQALLARAEADAAAAGARAAGYMDREIESKLEARLLSTALSMTALSQLSAPTQSRPGEFVFHQLMGQAANTGALDVDGPYNRDHRLVVGHLCSVSDQCRFDWGTSWLSPPIPNETSRPSGQSIEPPESQRPEFFFSSTGSAARAQDREPWKAE